MRVVTSSLEKKLLKFRVMMQLFMTMLKRTGCPVQAFHALKDIKDKYSSTVGQKLFNKVVKTDGRYFWRMSAPGFPSKASSVMYRCEIDRLLPGSKNPGLRSIVFAVTKKCTLNCEHCFEWDDLAKTDTLQTSDILKTVRKFQNYGTTQFLFTGGEPVLRLDDICDVVRSAAKDSDFWIFTSGMGLTPERAKKLKKAGLTGVLVSIDHYREEEHNRFRGSDKIFDEAIRAVNNANDAGLVTALSLCAHRDIVTKEHLEEYMEFAKNLKVTFVQILDPREAGRYKGKSVELDPDEISIIEDIYLRYNSEKEYQLYPIVNYLGYHQRRTGCFGGGDRFFYIDTDGDAHLCPYCRGKVCSAVELSADEVISKLSEQHCHAFKSADEV